MEKIKKFGNFLLELFSNVPVYLRAIIIFAFLVLFSFVLGQINKREIYVEGTKTNNKSYVILNHSTAEEVVITNGSLQSQAKAQPIAKRNMYYMKKKKKKEAELATPLRYFWNDNVFGSDDAPITIVEFSSFNCPYCISYQETVMNKIKDNYIDTGKVKYVKKIIIQKNTLFGVMLPQCASSNNAAYNVINELYKNTNKWINAKDQKKAIGELVYKYGFNAAGIESCFKNEKLANTLIDKQRNEIKELKVISTPTIFIDGERQSGNLSYEALSKVIDKKYEDFTKGY